MGGNGRERLSLGSLLVAVEDAPPVAAADVVGAWLSAAVAAREVSFLIADFSGRTLIRLGHAAAEGGDNGRERETAVQVELDGTPHGRVLASQAPEVVSDADGAWVLAPVTARGETVGVLEARFDAAPDDETVGDVALAGHALAYVVIANQRFTDLYVWGQRTVPLSLAAEVQHRLLPSAYTCEGGQFALAGWLEPAGDIAGDTFDYTLDRETLHLSMTDAMGHGLDAALLATLLVGALRNGRRRGAALGEQARAANIALAERPHAPHLVTGQLLRVDLHVGTAQMVNAGHPPPLRLRQGRVEELEVVRDLPFGIDTETRYHVRDPGLEPGDRLLFFTDGMVERQAENVDLRALLRETADMHPRQVVKHLTDAVLERCRGELRDDATVLCLDWFGGPPRHRDTAAGANR